MGDGYLGKCKDCTKRDTKERADQLKNDPAWVEAEKRRGREKYHRLCYRGKNTPTPSEKKRIMAAYWGRYPEKQAAHGVAQRVRVKGFHNHHWSYNEEHWKDVIFLTPTEHATIHRYLKYDQAKKMYRTKTGVLLNTRESHVAHVNEVFAVEGLRKLVG